MLQINWRQVEQIAEELYPRYRQGMRYSELEAELRQQQFDQDHINAIAEALEKRYREEQSKGVNIPLIAFAVIVSITIMVGIAWVFETGYIAIAAGLGILIFMAVRIVLRHKGERTTTRDRWK